MRNPGLLLAMIAGTALAVPVLSGGSALALTGEGWGTAIEVPGTAALNAGGIAQMSSMSCASSGNCVAGGWYTDASHDRRAFVADETGGVWGNAIAVPGAAALGAARFDQVSSVSCSSPGNCAAAGTYVISTGNMQSFVADEADGVWGNAIAVPGAAALGSGVSAQVSSLSCAPGAAGDCSVGGLYLDTSNHWQEFVADEASGAWGQAIEVPGTAALNVGGDFSVVQVSCPAPGACTVGGSYTDVNNHEDLFVARQASGVWGQAKSLSTNPSFAFNELDSLSCTSAGNCSAAGTERVPPSFTQLWVADEKNGKWTPTTDMPGLAALNAGGSARVTSLSCSSSGNCAAAGFYSNASDDLLPFVVNETSGVWGQAAEVPGIAALTKGVAQATKTTLAEPNSVSCSSTGNCALGGYYVSFIGVSRSNFQAFVAEEVNGVWLHALPVPGTSALNTGKQAMVNTVSCPRAGTCALGGTYAVTTKGNSQVFVDTRS